MKYEKFVQMVESELEKRNIKYAHTTISIRGKEQDVILIRVVDDMSVTINPVLYLKTGFENYELGESIGAIIEKMLRDYDVKKDEILELISLIREYESIKQYTTCKVINKERNKLYVKNKGCLHKDFLDLYIIPIIVYDDYAIEITENMRCVWGVSKSVIFNAALRNLKNEEVKCLNLNRVILKRDDESGMYAVSNPKLRYGAAKLLTIQPWEELKRHLGDKYWIIPSSVHECMAVPFDEHITATDIRELIKEVNATEISEEDYLSDNLYEFTGDKIIITEGGVNGEN